MSGQTARPASVADLGAVVELNNLHVPAVSPMDDESAGWFLANAVLTVVGSVDALLITLGPGSTYWSANYAWFGGQFDEFWYVDRIVVAASCEGQGVGRLLYAEAVAQARARGLGRVCAEVNLKPRNDRSLRFHERFGFVEVGQRTDAEGKLLSMLAYEVPAG